MPAVTGKVRGVSLRLLDALHGAAVELGYDVRIVSGFRSEAEQSRLYDGWKRRRPGFNPANPPGSSRHEVRSAADLGRTPRGGHLRDDAAARAALARRGVTWPIRGEAWHAEHTEDRRLSRAAALAAPHWTSTAPYRGRTAAAEEFVMATKAELEAVLDARLRDLDKRIEQAVDRAITKERAISPDEHAGKAHPWPLVNRIWAADRNAGAAARAAADLRALLERVAAKVGA